MSAIGFHARDYGMGGWYARQAKNARRIDTTRPWHVRMAQARRWHVRMMTVANRRPPNYEALMAAAAASVPDGWRLAPELTANDVRREYLRVIRRNLGNRRLP